MPWSLGGETPRILHALRGDPMTPARLAAQLAAAIRSAPPPGQVCGAPCDPARRRLIECALRRLSEVLLW